MWEFVVRDHHHSTPRNAEGLYLCHESNTGLVAYGDICYACNVFVAGELTCAECENCDECCPCRHCSRSRCHRPCASTCERCDYCEDCCECVTCERCECRVDNVCQYCERCVDGCCRCPTCGNCGTIVDAEELECGDCNRCSDCGCDCNNADFGPPFQKTHSLRFHGSPDKLLMDNPSPRHIGVEIECSSLTSSPHDLETTLGTWRASCVEDGSLSRGGFEIVTAPARGQAFLDQIDEICEGLRDCGAVANKQCGLHVHIDARDYSYYDVRKLIKLYARIEPALFAMVPPSRQNNHYCAPCGTQYLHAIEHAHATKDTKKGLWKGLYGSELDRDDTKAVRARNKYDCARYHALNLHSWVYRGTIECRLHAGTVLTEKIKSWGAMWASILDYVYRTPERKIDALPMHADSDAALSVLLSIVPPQFHSYINARIEFVKGL